MDEPAPATRPRHWPFALWLLTTIALLSLTSTAHLLIGKAAVLYMELEIRTVPVAAELLLKWIMIVPSWLPALAIACSGIPFVRRGDAEKTQRWALVVLLLMVLLASAVTAAILPPILALQTRLSK